MQRRRDINDLSVKIPFEGNERSRFICFAKARTLVQGQWIRKLILEEMSALEAKETHIEKEETLLRSQS